MGRTFEDFEGFSRFLGLPWDPIWHHFPQKWAPKPNLKTSMIFQRTVGMRGPHCKANVVSIWFVKQSSNTPSAGSAWRGISSAAAYPPPCRHPFLVLIFLHVSTIICDKVGEKVRFWSPKCGFGEPLETSGAHLEPQGGAGGDFGAFPGQKVVPVGLYFGMIFRPWPQKLRKISISCGF